MGTAIAAVLIVALALGPLGVLLVGRHHRLPAGCARAGRHLVGVVTSWRTTAHLAVKSRPIEDIAVDVRRLGRRFHTMAPNAPYLKVESVRAAYDDVLGECCQSLGLPHLLGVLSRGPEMDAERARVEIRLAASGLVFPNAA